MDYVDVVVVVFVVGVVHEFGCVCTFDPHASLTQQGFIKTKHTSLCVWSMFWQCELQLRVKFSLYLVCLGTKMPMSPSFQNAQRLLGNHPGRLCRTLWTFSLLLIAKLTGALFWVIPQTSWFLYLVLSKPSSFYGPRTSAFALFYSCWEKETNSAISYYIIMRLGLVKCSRNVNNILILF